MFKIGNVRIDGKLVLAPMEGVNCYAFRAVCANHGAALVSSPMIWATRLVSNPELELSLLNFKQEHPLSVQLGGAVPDEMKRATELVEQYADIIDVNLGCPKKEVLAAKAGSFFIKHPEQLKKAITPVVSSTNKPVTAKIRVGWDDKSLNTETVVRILEDLGVSAIAVHARTAKETYGARPRLEEIAKAKRVASVPVIGNGAVSLPGHAKSMLERTGCDAVMIGRAARGNSLIFSWINSLLAHGKSSSEPSDAERTRAFLEFFDLYESQERKSLSELSQQALWFCSGMKKSGAIRERILKASTAEQVKDAFEQNA